MGVIKQLKQFATGQQVFPITKTNAVYDNEHGRLDTFLKSVLTDVDSATEDITTLKSDLATVKGDMTTTKSDLVTLKSEVTTVDKEVGNLNKDVVNVGGRVTTLENTVNSNNSTVTTNITTLSGEVNTLKNTVTALGKDADTLEANMTTLGGKVTTLESSISTFGSDIDSVETQMSTVVGDVNTLTSQVNTLGDSVSSVETKVNTVTNSVDALTTQVNSFSNSIESKAEEADLTSHEETKGTASVLGHVTLSDAYSTNVGKASSGVGASQYALYKAYDALSTDIATMKSKGNKTTATLDFLDIGVWRIYGLTTSKSPSTTDAEGVLLNASAMNMISTNMSATFQIFYGKTSNTVYARLQWGDAWTNAWIKLSN